MEMEDFITLDDVYLAYKKAKTEAFYENSVPSRLKYMTYEESLTENLRALYKKLLSSRRWSKDLDFIGTFGYIPKSIDTTCWDKHSNIHYKAVDPLKDWNIKSERFDNKPKLFFRLMMDATVDFQVVSALWILKVGHKFEERLDKNLSYGNRLRRYGKTPFDRPDSEGELNVNTGGLFQPYFSAYQNWRNNGLQAMREVVEKGRRAVAITMDITSFFHNAEISFVTDDVFLKKIDVKLNKQERLFTELFISSLKYWYQSTPDNAIVEGEAIPVGLSASKILSNILLYEMDLQVNASLKPIYYGRYVDDFFIVIDPPQNVYSGEELIDFLCDNVKCLNTTDSGDVAISLSYAKKSKLLLKPEKQKVFLLDSLHGVDLINQIENQIRIQSSEYRLLPDLPASSGAMAKKALLATPDAKLEADSLRKADGVSIKRLGFSLLLKDINCYSQDLRPDSWSDIRHEFYGLVSRHILNPHGLFEFHNFISRVVSIAIACGDIEACKKLIIELNKVLNILEDTTEIEDGTIFERYKQFLTRIILQSVCCSATTKRFSRWNELSEILDEISSIAEVGVNAEVISDISHQLLLSDLGQRPYKDYWYYELEKDAPIRDQPKNKRIRKILRLDGLSDLNKHLVNVRRPHWKAMALATRPLTIQEIALIFPKVLEDNRLFVSVVWVLRGARTFGSSNIGLKLNNINDSVLTVTPAKNLGKKVSVALTNVLTTHEQWIASAKGKPDRSLARYENLNNLINNILKDNSESTFVVFPELSIPRRWAFSIARKLSYNGISFISGIEYYPHTDDRDSLHNDAMVSLVTMWPGYLSNVIYFQPKFKPSHGERKGLRELGKNQVEVGESNQRLPIYRYGKFNFGVLICSDLTNMQHRIHFQGKVDALFVLEWNRDTNTFSFLTDSAAHDIHTNIVQVNNRAYGDSRIRSPRYKSHERDIVRIKGGVSDFYVIADIEFDILRKYQICHLENDGDMPAELKEEYKPLPTEFNISNERKEGG